MFWAFPSIQTFSFEAPFKLFRKSHGADISIINDIAGFEKNLGANLFYAYRQDLGTGKLGIGINVGVFNKALNASGGSGWIFNDPSDNFIPPDDSKMAMDIGFGLHYKADNLYIG